MTLLPQALRVAGIFALLLGLLHFYFPALLDFRGAIPVTGASLQPLRLLGYRYQTTRRDVYGIAWVMNHCVSYVIVRIGGIDRFAPLWLGAAAGRILALWIAGFYAVRAGSQLYLGQRRGDGLVLVGFSSLALLHLGAAGR
jgi:hypothetical protein